MSEPRSGPVVNLVRTVAFVALAFFFTGTVGLVVAALAVVARELLGVGTRAAWITALVALACAPIATIVEGLPSAPVVGSGFGLNHLLAHRLVMAALVLAGYAALLELRPGTILPGGPPPALQRWRRLGVRMEPSWRKEPPHPAETPEASTVPQQSEPERPEDSA
jgi:hypothetical protein